MKTILLAIGISLYHLALCQGFYDSTLELGIEHAYFEGEYGGGVSFVDWDKNGWDDLTICQNGSSPKVYKNINGIFVLTPFLSDNTSELKQMTWVDFDNDGDRDLFTTSHLGEFKLYEMEDGILNDISSQVGFPQTAYLTYGNSWGDYNNDGFLDVYICNYNSDGITNLLYKNNGDGTFDDVTSELNIGNGSVYSFQALWIDYNNDGWQDLFVINDRLTASNTLYRNDGGIFTDVSEDSNMDYLIFSMSNTGGDYDNDGDLDIYVTNNPTGHLLHRNNNDGTFTEVADPSGVATYDMGWAAQWIDYDHDGWQDLHVCCSPFWNNPGQNKFFTNNGDGTFDFDLSVGFEGDEGWSHSSVVGDFNNDGSFDLFVVQDAPDASKMWTAIPSENNYLKVNLEGVISNRDGVGSRIEIFVNGQMQIRYSYCSEGYLSQNSYSEIFGISQASIVDSLKVSWLSGHEDIYYNVEANQTLNILEGSSLQNEIVYSGQDSICPGDSILLQAGVFSSYLWSTGDTTSSIYASTEGSYSVNVQMDLGLTIQSNIIELNIFPEPINEISTSGIVCFGDSSASAWASNIAETGVQSILWDSALMGDTLYSIPSGIHSCLLTDLNGCTNYSEFEILETDEIIVEFETNDVLCYGDSTGSATAIISGGAGNVLVDWDGINNDYLSAGEYSVQLIDSMLCSITGQFEINQADSISLSLDLNDANESDQGSASIDISGGTPPYEILWSTNEDTEDIENLQQGDYTVSVTDFNDCQHSMEFSIVNLGLEDVHSEELLIYPNPFSDYITIDFKAFNSNNLIIYNCLGEQVYYKEITLAFNNKVQLNLSTLEDGIYFIAFLQDEETSFVRPLLKAKNH